MFNKNAWVYITKRCNLSCPYCYNEINSSSSLMHDRNITNRVKFLLDILLKEKRIESIMFTGGEPMLAKETYSLIDYFKGRAKLAIYTNGTILSYKNIKKLSGVDVKISLHGSMKSSYNLRRYARMISILESEKNRYGFIYMITAENYKDLHKVYLFLRSKSKQGGFSMKYQPLVIEKRGNPEVVKLWEKLSLYNLSSMDWDSLEEEIEKIMRYEESNPLPVENPVFPFNVSSINYLETLRDFYLYGKRTSSCRNVPIIIIGSDGHVRPCMFLFDKIISSADGKESPYGDLIHDMPVDEIKRMRSAECFSEACICALKPTK